MNEKKIKYTTHIEVHHDGYREPKWGYKSIASDKVKRYRNVLSEILKLSKVSQDLLNYLADYMDKDNVVYSNGQFKDRFNRLIWKSYKEKFEEEGDSPQQASNRANDKKYSDTTLRKAYVELKKYNLIIPYVNDNGKTVRGCYWVNPEFFWKSIDSDREKKIKRILELDCNEKYIGVKSKKN